MVDLLFGGLNPGAGRDEGGINGGIVSEEAQARLRNDTSELDYMTHIVFRMYENKK
jgi:hypothetical protein